MCCLWLEHRKPLAVIRNFHYIILKGYRPHNNHVPAFMIALRTVHHS